MKEVVVLIFKELEMTKLDFVWESKLKILLVFFFRICSDCSQYSSFSSFAITCIKLHASNGLIPKWLFIIKLAGRAQAIQLQINVCRFVSRHKQCTSLINLKGQKYLYIDFFFFVMCMSKEQIPFWRSIHSFYIFLSIRVALLIGFLIMLPFQLMLSVWWLAIAQHTHGFISGDGIVKHDTLCFIHNLRLPHYSLLMFLLSEPMTSWGSQNNNSHKSSTTELPLNMTVYTFT